MGTKFGTGHTHPQSYHIEIGKVGSHATREDIPRRSHVWRKASTWHDVNRNHVCTMQFNTCREIPTSIRQQIILCWSLPNKTKGRLSQRTRDIRPQVRCNGTAYLWWSLWIDREEDGVSTHHAKIWYQGTHSGIGEIKSKSCWRIYYGTLTTMVPYHVPNLLSAIFMVLWDPTRCEDHSNHTIVRCKSTRQNSTRSINRRNTGYFSVPRLWILWPSLVQRGCRTRWD